MTKWPFVPARWFYQGRLRHSRVLLVIHTIQGGIDGRAAESCAHDFATRPSTNKASAHFCVTPTTPILTSSLEWVDAGELGVGDELVGADEFGRSTNGRTLCHSTVEAVQRRQAPVFRITLSDGRIVESSADHMWLSRLGGAKWEWVATDALRVGDALNAPIEAWRPGRTAAEAWLAGFLDGEGTIHKDAREVSFGQALGPVMDEALAVLDAMDLPYRISYRKPAMEHHKKLGVVSVSGLAANVRLLGVARPLRLLDASAHVWEGRSLGSRSHDPARFITEIEFLGEREVVSLSTSSRTYIANGVVSHNCIDLDSIVQCVKVGDTAFAAPGANADGVQFELAGRAEWTREEWLAHEPLLNWASCAVADVAVAHAKLGIFIPIDKLTTAEVKAGMSGLCGHYEVSDAYKKSTHTDPGRGFPWDVFLPKVTWWIGALNTVHYEPHFT